jgi:hypothetical protein
MAQRGRPQRKQRSRSADQSDDRDRDDVAFRLPGDALAVDVDVPGDIDAVQLAELPLLLTIRQAAKVLNVCPAKAYDMAHRYEATGCDGLPVIRLDKLYRVPRWAFAVLVQGGRVVTSAELGAHARQVLQQLGGQSATISTPPLWQPKRRVVRARPATGLRVVSALRPMVVNPVRLSSSGCCRGTEEPSCPPSPSSV